MNETFVVAPTPRTGAALLDASELQHVRAAIDAAPLRTDPSEHLYVEHFFSPAVYAEILRLFPTDPDAFRRWQKPTDSAPRFANYAQRHEIPVPGGTHRLTPEQDAFWTGISALLCGPEFARVLLARFGAYARARFGALLDDPSFIDERICGTMILNQHDPGYYLGPHTDRDEKLFTCVFYFPEHDGLDHLGTTLYRPLDPGFTCRGLAHHDPALFERGETMPYRANSALVFARTDVMFHGVHALTVDELQGSRRRGIQMQFFVRNERRREECAIAFDASVPPAMDCGEDDTIAYRLTNRAATELASSFPYTTQLGYRWFDAAGQPVEVNDGVGTELPGAIAPGETRSGRMRVIAPRAPGRYQLRLSAVQSEVAWFDDIDPGNGWAGTVTVGDPVSVERVADVFPVWASPARGFYALERDGETLFRWASGDASIALDRDRGDTLTFDIESGPGFASQPFTLQVGGADGSAITTVAVASRSTVTIPLGTLGEGVGLTLRAEGGGLAVEGDPRRLDFRVFAPHAEP